VRVKPVKSSESVPLSEQDESEVKQDESEVSEDEPVSIEDWHLQIIENHKNSR